MQPESNPVIRVERRIAAVVRQNLSYKKCRRSRQQHQRRSPQSQLQERPCFARLPGSASLDKLHLGAGAVLLRGGDTMNQVRVQRLVGGSKLWQLRSGLLHLEGRRELKCDMPRNFPVSYA